MPYPKCKIYSDGGHYIAIPHTTRPYRSRRKPKKEIIAVTEELAEEGDLKKATEDAVFFAMNISVSSAISASRKYADKDKISSFLTVLRLIYRDILMLRLGREDLLLSGGDRAMLGRAAARYTPAALVNAQDRIAAAEREIRFNANLSVCLETLFFGILEGR